MNRKARRAAASCARRKHPRGPDERGSNQLTHGKPGTHGAHAVHGTRTLDRLTEPERSIPWSIDDEETDHA
jgi:hypothetical protein